jgi:hypothetical protein
MNRVVYADWRDAEVDLGRTPQGRNHLKNEGIEVPIWHQLKPRCCICLEVLFRWNVGGHDAELTLMEEK